MSIGFRSGTRGDINSNAATETVGTPTGLAADDVMVCFWATGRPIGSTNVVTAPSGWTAISTALNPNDGANQIWLRGWWALGNVGNFGFSLSRTAETVGYVNLAYTGVDNANPIDSTAAGTTNTGANSLVTNELNIANDQSWHEIGMASWIGGTWTATGFTMFQNVVTPPASNEDVCLGYNTTAKGTGLTGTVTINTSAAASGNIIAAQPFALKPATAAAAGGGAYGGGFPIFRRTTKPTPFKPGFARLWEGQDGELINAAGHARGSGGEFSAQSHGADRATMQRLLGLRTTDEFCVQSRRRMQALRRERRGTSECLRYARAA